MYYDERANGITLIVSVACINAVHSFARRFFLVLVLPMLACWSAAADNAIPADSPISPEGCVTLGSVGRTGHSPEDFSQRLSTNFLVEGVPGLSFSVGTGDAILQQWSLIEFPLFFFRLMALGNLLDPDDGGADPTLHSSAHYRMKGALEVPITAQTVYMEGLVGGSASARSMSVLFVTPEWNAGPLPFYPVGFTATRESMRPGMDVSWWYVKEFLHERVEVKASGESRRFFERSIPGLVAEIETQLDRRFGALGDSLEKAVSCAHCWRIGADAHTGTVPCDADHGVVRVVDRHHLCLEIPSEDSQPAKMGVLFSAAGDKRRLARLRLEVPAFLVAMPGRAMVLDANGKDWHTMQPVSAWGDWILELEYSTEGHANGAPAGPRRFRVIAEKSGLVLFDAVFEHAPHTDTGQEESAQAHQREFKRVAMSEAEIVATDCAARFYLAAPATLSAEQRVEIRDLLTSLSAMESNSELRRSFHVLRLSVFLGEHQPIVDAFDHHFERVRTEFGPIAASHSSEDFLRWLLRRDEEDLFMALLGRWRNYVTTDATTEHLFGFASNMVARHAYWGAREIAAYWMDRYAVAGDRLWASRFQSLIARTHIAPLASGGGAMNIIGGGELPSVMRSPESVRVQTARSSLAAARAMYNELNDSAEELDVALAHGLSGLYENTPAIHEEAEAR